MRREAPGGQLPLMILAGVLDTAGNICFALAAQVGRLDIAALLSSFYPGTTALLAWLVLKERLNRTQWLGVAVAVTVILIMLYLFPEMLHVAQDATGN